ncbi:DUF4424 domain-containing protein [Bradyrhizobium genosp. L]|uniref:DUF4424 domain-containing protein n=1 Tax=Bradyrhizobium genosp. L TaxID=83637 RepID=UPI0018A28E23|nr:DUF4424 domain-containing protein [Bradyrhizobium genosp. L]QPF83019.1 DUF4424 domain-containing protein [Bradyrhizobium genosp. L]
MRLLPSILVLLAAVPLAARADDSTAALRAGGLVLATTDKIALVSEDLFLSAKAVHISYRFRNLTNADFETIIAFPMPDISGNPNLNTDIPDPASDNFLKFTTQVDGRPVESQVEQRAFLAPNGKGEIEITSRLRALHIPLLPTVDATEKAMAALRDDQRRSLADAEIVESQDFNDEKGKRTVQVPLWTLKSKFWRKQVFPAGKDVVVRQSYSPSLGSLSSLSFGSPDQDPAQKTEYRKKFCTDEAFTKAARSLYDKALADNAKTFQAFEQYLSYVITSGGHWAGPIGDFRLVVDKGEPTTLVSFCGDGVKKIGPTTFEMVVKNYVPQRDIDILFLRTRLNR